LDLDVIQRKAQLSGSFLAILFAEFGLSPLKLSKFLPGRFEKTIAPLKRQLSVFRHSLAHLTNPSLSQTGTAEMFSAEKLPIYDGGMTRLFPN
jgi:hypothetical protein